jgi:hypothetical protein
MRRSLLIVAMWLLVPCCGASSRHASYAQAGPPPGPAGPAAGGAVVATEIPEQLVIEGSVSVEVEEVSDVGPQLHELVAQLGGRVINEAVTGAEATWSARFTVRVPPNKVDDLLAFLAKHGAITDKRITASDVSKQLFDQDIALENLHVTLDRLAQVMAAGGLKVQEILQIEQEMTRLRGQIEQLEGDQRFLKDRVALATLEIAMSRREGAVTAVATAKVYPGARAATLVLFDPGTRTRVRYGGGFVMHTVLREMSLEVDLFQKEPNAAGTSPANAVIATVGGASYSDFLGGGRRQLLNPYLGFRLGYAYLDDHRFVVQGEAGVELFKARNVVLDANVRATGLIASSSDLALVAGAGATFAF